MAKKSRLTAVPGKSVFSPSMPMGCEPPPRRKPPLPHADGVRDLNGKSAVKHKGVRRNLAALSTTFLGRRGTEQGSVECVSHNSWPPDSAETGAVLLTGLVSSTMPPPTR